MSAAHTLPANVVETVLSLLVPFILPAVHNDPEAARATAWQMLADYRTRTPEEFRLAGQIVSFSLQALKALADAADPALSFIQLCRYRSAAVSLKRAEVAAQRRLDALLKASPAEVAAEPEAVSAATETAAAVLPDTAGPPAEPAVIKT